MSLRSWYAVAAAATLALAACSEREPQSATGPELAGGITDPCGFSNSLVTGYFPSSRHSSIISLKQSMANAGHGTPNARTAGFQIMDSIGSVSRNFAVSPAAGAQLTVAVIGCMFDNASTFTYPHQTDPASDFTATLTNATGGAYYVRGGGTAGADNPGRSATVLGRIDPPGGVNGNLSGIAPASGSWTSLLPASVAEGRALFYGYPVPSSNPLLFEWATVPSELTFSPAVVVSVCDNEAPSGTAMVHEEAVGVLAYVNSSICSTPQSFTMIERGWGPQALAARLTRVLVSALAPAPLQATALLTGTGGKTSTIPKSRFGKQSVGTLFLNWQDTPPATINGTAPGTTNPVSVAVSTSSTSGSAIVGACAYLTGTNNNGTPTQITSTADQDPTNCTNPPGGNQGAIRVQVQRIPGNAAASLADFGLVGVTKTGGMIFTVTVDVLGRDGAGSIFTKSNVKPAK
jgi:hypothetical protein